MNSFQLPIAVLLLCVASSQAHTPGTVTVDSLTFDKVIRRFDVVLAKFDDKYRTYMLSRMNDRSTVDLQLLATNRINSRLLLKMWPVPKICFLSKFPSWSMARKKTNNWAKNTVSPSQTFLPTSYSSRAHSNPSTTRVISLKPI